jgi:O-antigen chain-terminating methyltransferase
MDEQQTMEEIMRRIRSQVRVTEQSPRGDEGVQRSKGSQGGDNSKSSQVRVDARDTAGRQSASEPSPAFTLKLHSLSQLVAENSTAVQGTRQVGQINPRPPGVVNGCIQFVKKVMRRSLTWYTRPLHYFQGGVVRALDQIAAILDNHSDSFRKVASELTSQRRMLQQQSAEIERLQRDQPELASKVGAIQAALDERLEAQSVSLHNKLATFHAAQESALMAAISPQEQKVAAVRHELELLRDHLHRTRVELQEVSSRARIHDRDVRRLLFNLQNGSQEKGSSPTPPMFASEIKSDEEFDYFSFEDLYRGNESDIRKRQHEYLEYFKERQDVVDVGCGRGEFLELLRDNNISARGVELGLDQYLLCREKGLDVVREDLFAFLEGIPDSSLGGLFSAQVIEHLTASDQLRYVGLAYRKTAPGSPVIFETINAQCVYAVMRNFFLDPTHVRPLHPETLKFAMETMQFKNVELRFSGPVSDKQIPPLKLSGNSPQLDEFNRAMKELNNLIYGDQDYAAIGWH